MATFRELLNTQPAPAPSTPLDPVTAGGPPTGPSVPNAAGGTTFRDLLTAPPPNDAERFAQELPEGIMGFLQQASSGFTKALGRLTGQYDTPEPSTFTKVTRPSSIAVGATAGGIMGSRIPVAPGIMGLFVNPVTGAVGGGVLGSIAGTFAPETTLQLAEWLGIVPKGTRESEGRPYDELKKIAEGEAYLDATFGVAGQIPRLLARPLARATNKITKESEDLARFAHDRLGIDLLPWQVGHEGFGRRALNVLGRFPMVGSPARGTSWLQSIRTGLGQRGTEEAARTAIEKLPSRFGNVDTFPDLSHALLGDADTLLRTTAQQFDQVYTQIWNNADRYAIWVSPTHTLNAVGEIRDEILKRTPSATSGEILYSSTNKQLIDFIEKNINTLADTQTLRQMHGVADNLDTFIKGVEPAQRGFIMRNVNILREAIKKDMVDSLNTPAAKPIADALATTDETWHKWLADTFETATAKKFGKVRKHGIRGWGFDRTTQSAIDGVAEHILDLNSPQAIDELLRLAGQPTAQRLAATVVEQGLKRAMVQDGVGKFAFDVKRAQDFFGIGDKTSGRFKAMERLLNSSGSPLGMADLDRTFEVMRAISSFSVGNASDFIARRGTLGGTQAIINGILLTGGGTMGAGAVAGPTGSFAAGLLMFLGARGFARAISNPHGARAWREVASKEAGLGNRRASALRLLHLGITDITNRMITEDQYEPTEVGKVKKMMTEQGSELIRQLGDPFVKGFTNE